MKNGMSYARLIALTGNRLAPMILGEAKEGLKGIEGLLGKHADRRWISGVMERLTVGFMEEEWEEMKGNPAFLVIVVRLAEECLARFNKGE